MPHTHRKIPADAFLLLFSHLNDSCEIFCCCANCKISLNTTQESLARRLEHNCKVHFAFSYVHHHHLSLAFAVFLALHCISLPSNFPFFASVSYAVKQRNNVHATWASDEKWKKKNIFFYALFRVFGDEERRRRTTTMEVRGGAGGSFKLDFKELFWNRKSAKEKRRWQQQCIWSWTHHVYLFFWSKKLSCVMW